MLVMTAKVNKKKLAIIFTAVIVAIAALAVIFRSNNSTTPTVSTGATDNAARVQFLKEFGWEVNETPTESSQVKIPKESSQIFERYNELQKSQGYDLSKFAGKTVMRYVYEIKNFPGATDPVYATILVYKNEIIGGDVTDTAAKGKIQGFKMVSTGE